MNQLLEKIKMALRITTTAYDSELTDIINAALTDLGIAGVIDSVLVETNLSAIVTRAVATYAKVNFGVIDSADYDRLKASYDEQKAQLVTASGFTDWGVDDV